MGGATENRGMWMPVLCGAAGLSVVGAAIGAHGASEAFAGLAVLAGTALLVRRGRTSHSERGVWLRWAACLPAAAGAIALEQSGVPAVAAVLMVGGFPLAYGAAVRWNRYATSLADPHEIINGVASVVVLVAITDLVTRMSAAGISELPWQQRLVMWSAPACAVIIALTLATVIRAAGLARDARAWLVLVGVCSVAVLLSSGFLGLPPAGIGLVLAVTSLTFGWAAHLPPTDLQPVPVDATASTIGGFAVLIASIGALLAASAADVQGLCTWLAAAAACLSAFRLLRNMRDIAALNTSRQEALTDDLTGMANRRALLRRAHHLLQAGEPLVLAIIDLDGFKQINDGLGHAAGDELLREVAHRLHSVLPNTDLLGRLGGDEFAVLAPLHHADEVTDRMTRLTRDLQVALSEPQEIAGFLVHGSGSIGVTSTHHAAPVGSTAQGPQVTDELPRAAAPGDVSEMLRQADAALYEAKTSRGSAVVYDPSRHADHGQLQLLEELRTALDRGELVLHHQPQVDVATGRLVGVEALVRWEHPTRGLVPPIAFLDLAESQGLMGQLTDRVLAQAIAQLASWRSAGLQVRMSVNLSASNLLDVGLPARLRALLVLHDVPAEAVTLEVTETVLVQDSDSAASTLLALSAAGVDLSIDDFGTGWSSLAYLRRLPARELKLDASFTRDLLTDRRTSSIVASTITLAHELGLRVVAEGVEDQPTLLQLCALGCDLSQGYLHARPMPAVELLRWARDRSGPSTALSTPRNLVPG